MIEYIVPYADYVIYALVSLFSFGILIAAPTPIRDVDFLLCVVGALLWPIFLTFWIGTAVRSCLEKYLVS
jgi:hypothetical protein